jgi:excisionase family DNA binding protein
MVQKIPPRPHAVSGRRANRTQPAGQGPERDRHDDRPALLTAPQVATSLQVSLRTIRRLIRSGALPVVRIGRTLRVRGADLEAFLKTRSGPGERSQDTSSEGT